jgi:phage-related baseplate assembly protein
MSGYRNLDLSALAVPPAIAAPGFSAILSARLQSFLALYQQAQAQNPSLPDIDSQTLALVTDPANIHLRVDSYREVLLVQSINDAQLNTFLAWARGPALDAIAAFVNVSRATGELDPMLRIRTQLAWEALSIGGTYGRYTANALGADPVGLAGVAVYGHEVTGVPLGQVWIICMGANGSGLPSPQTLAAVVQATSPRSVRPVNDCVQVKAVAPDFYSIDATLMLAPGADAATVIAAQTAALNSFCAARQKIGALVTPNNIAAVAGYNAAGLINDVVVRAPAANVGGDPFAAPILTGIRLVPQVAS